MQTNISKYLNIQCARQRDELKISDTIHDAITVYLKARSRLHQLAIDPERIDMKRYDFDKQTMVNTMVNTSPRKRDKG